MKQKVIYLLAMLCFAQTMMAQLTSLGLVEESNIANADKNGAMRFIPELSFAGDYLYVATPNGVFKTPYGDAEASSKWEKLPLTDSLVLDIEVRGNTLIALTRDQLIYSVNGGKTAKSMSATEIMGDDKMYTLECMAVHPHNAKELLVTNGTKLMWTNDGGEYWEEIRIEGPTPLTRLFYNPSDATQLIGISNDYDSGALLYSHDGGQKWECGAGVYYDGDMSEIYNVAFHPKIGDKMAACGVGVYGLSDDGGASWTGVFEPRWGKTIVRITDILYDARKPNVLYGADWSGIQEGTTSIVRSTDGGYTWKTFYEASLAPNAHVLSIEMKDNLLALYTYGGGIYLLDVDAVGKPKIPTCLVSEDKQWAVCTYNFKGDYWTNTYRLRGDTTINGKTYKIEHESQEADLSDMRPSGRYMREENGKVYSITDKDKREELFFDYTMQIGDTLRYNPTVDYYGNVSDSYQCIRLAAIRDTVMPNGDGKVRKAYHVQSGRYDEGVYRFDESLDGPYIFIEDIGFVFDGLSHPTIDIDGSWSTLLYVQEDYTTLYMADQEHKFFSKDTKWYGKIYHRYNSGHSEQRESLTYHIGSDTITDRGFGQNLYRNNEYWGTLITKGEQVWIYPSHNLIKEFDVDSQKPFLLYDFSLQPGDTLYYDHIPLGFSREKPKDGYYRFMVVEKVFHTCGRKVIEFDRGYKWAEGIGRLGAPILNIWRILTTNGDGITEGIDRVEENGQVICSNGEIVNPDIEPWLKAGMTWTENKQYTKDGAIVSRKVTISEGDAPRFYKVSSDDSEYEPPFKVLEVVNDKIYGHGFGDVFLLYDFSLKVGDYFLLIKSCSYGSPVRYDQCHVTKVDTAVYNGIPRKRITLSGYREDVWVEGIGSLTRVFPIDAVDYDESVNAIFSEVVECTYNGETLYQKNFTPPTPKTYLVTEGKQWAVYHNNPLCSKHHSGTTTYRLQGETILYGKTYKKMWVSYKEDLSDMKPFNGYMREENGKVYFANSYEEKLWFDYTVQVGDTLCFKENSEYGRILNIYEALLSETDSTRSYRCYEMQVGKYNISKKKVEFSDQQISVYEGLGVIGRDMSYGLCEHYYQSSYGKCAFTLLCVHDGENILYQTHVGCYKPLDEKPRPTNRKGYGIYYGDSYLYQYTINEAEEVTDSTDFARWHDKTVIYFDVDSVGPKAFTNTCFRQGQTLYFTEKLRYIGQDAFSNIMMLDNEPEIKNPFGDLCIVFSGENPPSIGESSIVNYADTTYRITYVVPDLATYIGNDIQWTYSQLVTIDDFIAGYISPENEVVVSDSAGVDLEVGVVDDGAGSGITVLYATARPKKDIPVRIGDSNGGDIYSRAPAWMRYTVEIKVTDSKGDTLYTEKKQCSAYEECHFETTLTSFPEDGIVYVYSRSIDQYGNASDWTMKKIHLMSIDSIAAPVSQSLYYDLMGRKVTNPTRGIYIKDGRKVIVK